MLKEEGTGLLFTTILPTALLAGPTIEAEKFVPEVKFVFSTMLWVAVQSPEVEGLHNVSVEEVAGGAVAGTDPMLLPPV